MFWDCSPCTTAPLQVCQYQYVSSDTRSTWNPIVNLDAPESFTKFFGMDSAALSDSNVQYDFASLAPKMQSDFYNATDRGLTRNRA